jgi:hypothetical protein
MIGLQTLASTKPKRGADGFAADRPELFRRRMELRNSGSTDCVEILSRGTPFQSPGNSNANMKAPRRLAARLRAPRFSILDPRRSAPIPTPRQ